MQATLATPFHSDPSVQAHFDRTADLYVDHELACYRRSVEERIALLRAATDLHADDEVRLLDLGCGGGAFVDQFLEALPQSTALGVDISFGMLQKNRINPRKELQQADLLALPEQLGRFDVIAIDTVMHHLISRAGYTQTLENITHFLCSLHKHMEPGGTLLIREIYHEYFAVPSFGSRTIYEASTLSVPAPIAKLLRRAGIQTANVGVCFLTRSQWQQAFADAGFAILAHEEKPWPGQPYRKYGFRQSGDLHFLLTRARPQV